MTKATEDMPLCDTCCKRVESVNETGDCEDCHDKWEAAQIAYWRPLYLGEKQAGLLDNPHGNRERNLTSNLLKNCKACGDIIRVSLANHKRGWGNFCDKACAAAFKCGQRPEDVNERHAKHSPWAAAMWEARVENYNGETPPKAPPIKEQLGFKPKVKHKLHSPEKPVPQELQDEWDHNDACAAMEECWDGHKHGRG